MIIMLIDFCFYLLRGQSFYSITQGLLREFSFRMFVHLIDLSFIVLKIILDDFIHINLTFYNHSISLFEI